MLHPARSPAHSPVSSPARSPVSSPVLRAVGRALLALALSAPLAACTSAPPSRWAQGGAQLAIARARWERPSDTVDLLPDGRVMVDGEHLWTIDAAGRVSDNDRGSIAVLDPNGQLQGNDDRSLGVVGMSNASAPGSGEAWLSLQGNGQVTYYDGEGERRAGGAWVGCQGPVFRTCTLVSHLVTLREVSRRPRVSVGVGMGVGFGVRR
jgi:hypothetical protein